jgi:hypothetical protein
VRRAHKLFPADTAWSVTVVATPALTGRRVGSGADVRAAPLGSTSTHATTAVASLRAEHKCREKLARTEGRSTRDRLAAMDDGHNDGERCADNGPRRPSRR